MRRIVIFFLGVVFLVIAAEVLLFSPRDVRNANRDVGLEESEGETAPSGDAAQLLTDLELIEAGDEGKEWTLRSKEAALYEKTKEWVIKGVEVQLYGQNQTQYIVNGDTGKVSIETKDIWVNGNVTIKSANGYVMETERVMYSGKERRLTSETDVVMWGPRTDGIEPLQVRGTGLAAELNTNKIYLLTKVRANRPMQDNSMMAIQSESAEFSGESQITKFIRSVVVDYGGTRITGPFAEFRYGKTDMKSMSVSGGVRVTDVEKWATANEIEMLFAEQKYILRGDPRVVQNNDELVGQEIVFLRGGKEIQVKGAKAKFENEKVSPFE